MHDPAVQAPSAASAPAAPTPAADCVSTRLEPGAEAGFTDAERADQHTAYLATQIGAACALIAAMLAAIALVWLNSFGYRIALVHTTAIAGLIACLAELGIIVALWRLWRRVESGHTTAADPLPGRGLSVTLHWLGYLVTLVAVCALVWAMGWIALDQIGFWLLAVAATLILIAHSTGGVQFLRRGGPAGTPRAHLQRFVARSNAKADAELDEEPPAR